MARLIHHGIRLPRRERGFAMIALISLIALMSMYLIAYALSRTGAELSNERERRSMNALRQAKAALIAYAASEQWQLYKCSSPPCRFQPGALPCPANNTTGTSAGALCSSIGYRVGRLPWATIGSDDLRDASGEQLWYAVSSNFYKTTSNIINSDTQGLLTVTGTAPASNVVAIIFAPGPVIQDSTLPGQIQDRSPANIYRLASYLECVTTVANDYRFASYYTLAPIYPLPTCTSSILSPDMFNDRLLVITQADLMAAVEPVVAARIKRDIQPYFDAYKAAWGRYPFAVPFVNPGTATDNYKGTAGNYSGLLPIGSVAWDTNYGAANPDPNKITLNLSTPPGTSGLGDCSSAAGTTTSMVQCNISYSCTLSPSVCPTATLTTTANVGDGLVAPTPTSAISVLPGPSSIASVSSSSWSQLNNSDNATVTVNITMGSSVFPSGTVTIQVPAPAPDATTNPVYDATANPSTSKAYWFVSNQWYRQVFYAVAPAFAPGTPGSGDCHISPPCLTVNNLPGSPANAILILAGRSLSSNPSRPNATLSDYLESLNFSALTSPTTFFEHRAGMPTSINDRVVVISP